MASPEVQSPRPLRERSPPNEAPSPRHDDDVRSRGRDRDDERDRARDRDREPDRKRRRDDRDRDRDRDRGGDRYRPAASTARDRSPPPRQRQERVVEKPPQRTEEEKQAMLKAEYQKLLDMRSGGTYIPPARLRALQAQIQQDTSAEGARLKQKLHWEALKKSITGIINKVNLGNIKSLVPELFEENLVRGRGAYCRAIMRAQASSLSFTPIYAALTAVVNSKIPLVGELLAKRLVVQFRKSFRRDDKKVCLAATTFIAHLVNFQVVHENLALQMLQLLLHKPTDDSVEIAVGFMKEIGEFLTDMKPMAARVVFDKFRDVLHEGDIDKRVQYAVEVLFQIRKDNFKDNPAIREELDLLEEDDMITHYVELDGELDTEDSLNIFKFDADFEKSEEKYIQLKREILGEASDDEEDEEDEDESSEDEEDEEQKAIEIKDQSNADLVNLRRTIYLTIQSAISPEEAVHKLMKIVLPPGQEPELPSMVVECCSQATTYQKFYGLIGERFAKLNRLWNELFEEQFRTTYETIHRYETNRLRNVARFFGHMFASDAIGWHCMSNIVMTEEATTSSSRIFVKILFQEISEELGMPKLTERMKDPLLQPSLEGLFPRDEARNVRFSINYFTSIGMGVLTEEMREFLQNMPKPTLPAPPRDDSDSESVSSYTSYTGSSYSSRSRSRTPARRRRGSFRSDDSRGRSISRDSRSSRSRSYSRSVTPRRGRGSRHSSYDSRSPSPKRSRRYSDARTDSRSRSRTPPLRTRRQASSVSLSPSPEPRRRGRRDSYSASPSPRRGIGRRRHDSRSPSRTPSRSPVRGRSASYDSRSPTPARAGRQPRRRERFSPSPVGPDSRAKARARDASYSRSPSRSISRSRSRSPANTKRRRYSSSRSRSPAPPPTKRGRRSD
ncbi:hypothetical protein jhhlp_006921 [Lomentospora prolificans]|uniref:Pre-mRNA-splicing factor CWC22 n=1 Tax=Lomentospora prolificans TaxID=41688 RepID=A0A2N3N335_9PEZI|nr:hypothetical protein jhhlp_006921 [Lomentospora prolificans]